MRTLRLREQDDDDLFQDGGVGGTRTPSVSEVKRDGFAFVKRSPSRNPRPPT
jgi:hypothetical protein